MHNALWKKNKIPGVKINELSNGRNSEVINTNEYCNKMESCF